jgi:hypothetical protein
VFTGAKKDRGNRQMQVVDKSGSEVLLDGGDASSNPDVLALGSVDGSFKCRVDAFGDEVKGGTAAHDDRFARVVGKHENGSVVRRVVTPPSFPGIVRPGSSYRPEHVAPQYPGSDIFEATRGEVVVDAGRAAFISKHLLKGSGGERPFVQGSATNTERIVEVLVNAGAKAVERYREAENAEFGHYFLEAPEIFILISGIQERYTPAAYRAR